MFQALSNVLEVHQETWPMPFSNLLLVEETYLNTYKINDRLTETTWNYEKTDASN